MQVPIAPTLRLESLECEVSAACIRAAQAYQAAAVLDVGGGKAMLLAPDSPMNSVKGVGMGGPVSAADLDAIRDFFTSHGCTAAVAFDACPFADESLAGLIGERGWTFAGFEQVLWRPVSAAQPDPAPAEIPGVSIAIVGESRAEEWALVLARVFSGMNEPPRWQIDIGLRSFNAKGGAAWAAVHEGHIVGAARSFVLGGAAALSGAAVMPAYRGRGIQTAMLLARLKMALEQGCDLAKIDTKPGTGSQRNAHRLGFHVAYTRAQFMMPLA